MDQILRPNYWRTLIVAGLVFLAAGPAFTETLIFTAQGELVSVDAADTAGLDGARFRLTVSIDAAELPARTEQDAWHQAASYATPNSMLELSNSLDGASDGVFVATLGELELVDSFGSDYCIEFGSNFDTPAGIVSVPRLCFRAGSATGVNLSTVGISTENLTAFLTTIIGAGSYGVINGTINVNAAAH